MGAFSVGVRGSFAIAACLIVTACPSLQGGAREDFVNMYTCPAERVSVTPRGDIAPHTLYWPDRAPPADVSADPERLRLWKEQEAERMSVWDRGVVFEVEGCGHHILVACEHRRPDHVRCNGNRDVNDLRRP